MPRLQNHDSIDTVPENAKAVVEDLNKAGKFINIFKGMVNSGPATEGYLAFSKAIGRGTIGNKAREAIALYLAQANSCDYCLTAHGNLARNFKFSDDDMLNSRKGEGHVVDERVSAAVHFAKALWTSDKGFVSDADIQAARDGGLSDGDIIEVIATVVLNLFTNYVNHVHDTQVDLPNPQKVTPV